MIKRLLRHVAVGCCIVGLGLWLSSCNFTHDGPTAFKASQKAAMKKNHFNVELERHTRMGDFKNSQALDCDAQYFYDHEVVERSPEAIESGVTLLQGRPSKHQEYDTLFVGGKTYGKNTSSWENAPISGEDETLEWATLTRPRDPKDECMAMKRGESLGYVAYDLVLKEGHIEYMGKQRIGDHKCGEYNVTFSSRVLKSSRVCIGTSDDLPYRVIGEDYMATYNYGPVSRLPAPAPGKPAASSSQ